MSITLKKKKVHTQTKTIVWKSRLPFPNERKQYKYLQYHETYPWHHRLWVLFWSPHRWDTQMGKWHPSKTVGLLFPVTAQANNFNSTKQQLQWAARSDTWECRKRVWVLVFLGNCSMKKDLNYQIMLRGNNMAQGYKELIKLL